MPRRHNKVHPRFNPQANREKRNTIVMKAFRMLDGESSSALSGIVRDLERDGSLPKFASITGCHPVYILDPHAVKKEFSSGFRSAYRFETARVKRRIREEQGGDNSRADDYLDAKVGTVSMLGISNARKRLLVASVLSETLIEDRKSIYEILGEEGLKGFERMHPKKIGAPAILLGTTLEPVCDEQARLKIAEIVETAVAIHDATNITLGPLQVR